MAEFYVTPGKIGQGHDNNQREKKSDLPQLNMEIEKNDRGLCSTLSSRAIEVGHSLPCGRT